MIRSALNRQRQTCRLNRCLKMHSQFFCFNSPASILRDKRYEWLRSYDFNQNISQTSFQVPTIIAVQRCLQQTVRQVLERLTAKSHETFSPVDTSIIIYIPNTAIPSCTYELIKTISKSTSSTSLPLLNSKNMPIYQFVY